MQVELSPYVKFRRPAGQRNIEISSIDTSSEERLQFAQNCFSYQIKSLYILWLWRYGLEYAKFVIALRQWYCLPRCCGKGQGKVV